MVAFVIKERSGRDKNCDTEESCSASVVRFGAGQHKVLASRSAPCDCTVYFTSSYTLSKTGADVLAGKTKRFCGKRARKQIYRGLEHGLVRTGCGRGEIMKTEFPLPIQGFGNLLINAGSQQGRLRP